MKNVIFTLSIFILLISCKENNKYKDKYPFFNNIDYLESEDSIVSMNNFKSKANKDGLEYLLSNEGTLIESRVWKNNHLNGMIFSYTESGKLHLLANYINDTLCGAYFELDTTSGKILNYREKLKTEDGIIENQNIYFSDGVIDKQKGQFYLVNKIGRNRFIVKLFGKLDFLKTKFYVIESETNSYNFDALTNGVEFDTGKPYLVYELYSKTKKYIVGCIVNYNDSSGVNNQVLGRMIYFKSDGRIK